MRIQPRATAIAAVVVLSLASTQAHAKSGLLEILAQKGIISADEYAELKAEQKAEAAVNTDDGFKVSSKDSSTPTPPTFQVGTLQQLDFATYSGGNAALSDGSELRRSRLSIQGAFLSDWQYRVEYEFSGTTGVTDAYVSYNALKPVVLTFGQFKQPFGMEAYASDKNLTFMERGLPFAFVTTRAPGIGVGSNGANWTLNGGLFGEPVGNAQAGDDGYGAAARGSWTPVVNETACCTWAWARSGARRPKTTAPTRPVRSSTPCASAARPNRTSWRNVSSTLARSATSTITRPPASNWRARTVLPRCRRSTS